ncbi:hypothetical protein [Dokdonia sp. Asnod1-B02]|uniref:hypothetical protein n=1 Tax=Dokdonia sp. Asnod1-B02 TaxID=3160573 RepID=UPI0038668311
MQWPVVRNMKKLYFIILSLVFFSCENQLELSGNWVIIEMAHSGEKVYPQTESEQITISVSPIGYEGSEKIKFNIGDSTVTFPGFQSDILKSRFSIRGDSIFFRALTENAADEKNSELTRKTFLGDFKIIRELRKENIRLKSKLTIIRLINEEYLFDKRLDDILR